MKKERIKKKVEAIKKVRKIREQRSRMKNENGEKKPNILFILVDELRFPSVFPKGTNDAGDFFKKYMPNVYRIWEKGVKFSNYHTAASACTPARGTLLTGLYNQQTWLCTTLTAPPDALPNSEIPHAPILRPEFPTYGKLLREAGYQTPYIGKWHVSLLNPDVEGLGLEEYGFDGKVYADPVGYNLQGTVGSGELYPNDEDTAEKAIQWLNRENTRDEKDPWCLTVGFVNPHDREFFWGGTEFVKYNELMGAAPPAFTLYSQESGSGAPYIAPQDNPLNNPEDRTSMPYPEAEFDFDLPNGVPPNWESGETMETNKPSTQYLYRKYQALVWGGVTDDETQDKFHKELYPNFPEAPFEIGMAPYSYWQRGMDSYMQVRQYVDVSIGKVLDAIPEDELDNTVIIFASDHGDYSGAHGFLSGKLGSVYKEAFNVPLIVADPTGQFTAEPEIIRDGLVSSVDFLNMMVSLGHNGNQDWLQDEFYNQLYGNRHDLLAMLKSSEAPGREYALLAIDEVTTPSFFNFNNSATHILGLLNKAGKLGTYANWEPNSDRIMTEADSFEYEYYDYVEDGQAELINRADSPQVKEMMDTLFKELVPNELRAPLPASLLLSGGLALVDYLNWEEYVTNITIEDLQNIGASGDDSDQNSKIGIHALGRSF